MGFHGMEPMEFFAVIVSVIVYIISVSQPWGSMEFHGTPWNSLQLLFLLSLSLICKDYQNFQINRK